MSGYQRCLPIHNRIVLKLVEHPVTVEDWLRNRFQRRSAIAAHFDVRGWRALGHGNEISCMVRYYDESRFQPTSFERLLDLMNWLNVDRSANEMAIEVSLEQIAQLWVLESITINMAEEAFIATDDDSAGIYRLVVPWHMHPQDPTKCFSLNYRFVISKHTFGHSRQETTA